MMHTVILIDDETLILESLKNVIPWNELNCHVIATACNGKKGIELINALNPDIVICDIVMPTVTGLELTRHCHKTKKNCKIILLSAYSDFQYARTALQYGAVNYVLKPIDTQELQKAIRLAQKTLKEQELQTKKENQLKELALEAETLAANSILFNIARYGTDFVSNEQGLSLLKDKLTPSVVVNLHFFNVLLENDHYCKDAKEFYKEFFEKEGYILLFGNTLSELLFLCPIKSDIDPDLAKKRIVDLLNIAKTIAPKSLGIIVASMSNIYTDCDQLHACYQQCIDQLAVDFFYTKSEVITSAFVPATIDDFFPSEAILNSLNHGNAEQLHAWMEKGCQYLVKLSDKEKAKYCLRELHREGNIAATKFGIIDKPVIRKKYHTENIYAQLEKLETYLQTICEHMKQNHCLVNRIKMIIEKEYANSDLSLTVLADMLNITPSYLSRLFKKELSENFSDYLTQTRLVRAMFLLRTTTLKNNEIAKQVGFEDDHYFSQVFKKKCSITPKQYRDQFKK